MSNRHFIHVDSRSRNKHESVNNFTVHLSQPLKHVNRVGVLSFQMPNTNYNVHHGNQDLTWFEIHLSGGTPYYRLFTVTLDIGYYQISDLMDQIVSKMNATSGRQVNTETTTTYSWSVDADYRISILGTASTSAASDRYWGFYTSLMKINSSIAHNILGYTTDQILVVEQIRIMAYPSGSSDNDALLPLSTNATAWARSQSSLTAAERTLKARFSYSENQPMWYLASDTLAENTYSTELRPGPDGTGYLHTVKSSILASVPVHVNRWSYINLNLDSQNLVFHSMDNATVSSFDLKLLNDSRELYTNVLDRVIPDYKCVLVFETIAEDHREMAQLHQQVLDSAYRLEHRR